MKTITKLLLLLHLFISASVFGQTGNLTIRTTVFDLSTGQPVPNHLVMLTVYPDSMNILYPINDSALTDPAGFCEISIDVPYSGQGFVSFSVSTPECNNNLQTQYFTYSGQSELINVEFFICGGMPSGCENYIENSIQDFTVYLTGGLYNQQEADYFWQFGDGTSGTGQNVSHTYNGIGSYIISLETITTDSCYSMSEIMIVFPDSINFDCVNFIEVFPMQNPLEIQFFGNVTSQYPSEFDWNFGDPASGVNNSSTIQNPVHLYTAPGVYTVTLSTIDSTGCQFTSSNSVFVGGNPEPHPIFGSVIAGNSLLDSGTVTLFLLDSMGYYFPVQNTIVDSMMYFFPDVFQGTYLIQAQPSPNSMFFGSYLPTFYESSLFWEDATQIILGPPMNPYNINLVPFDSIEGGPGLITGQILNGGKSPAQAGIEILLLNENGEPVGLAYTDADGTFSFTNLPLGIYQLNPVIAGYTIDIYPCNLDESNQSAEMVLEINGHEITAIRKTEKAVIAESCYPNPASNILNVRLTKTVSGNHTVRIFSNNGVLVNSSEYNSLPGDQLSINVKELSNGLYTLLLIDAKGTSHALQFVKQ